MDIALPLYLFTHFLHQIRLFFERWYVGSFWAYGRYVLRAFQRLDRTFALRVTLRNWLLPLYQDYTILGYIFGFLFRTARIVTSFVLYSVLAVLSLFFYALWLATPLYFLWRAIVG